MHPAELIQYKLTPAEIRIAAIKSICITTATQ